MLLVNRGDHRSFLGTGARRCARRRRQTPQRREHHGQTDEADLVVGIAGALTVSVGSSVALANDHEKNGTDSFVDIVDCTGNLYNITITFNSVFHEANGKATSTANGTFVATPVAAGQAASGHFTMWENFHENADGSVAGNFTFHVNGKYADGTPFSIHQQGQFKAASDGTVIKDRFHDSCAA